MRFATFAVPAKVKCNYPILICQILKYPTSGPDFEIHRDPVNQYNGSPVPPFDVVNRNTIRIEELSLPDRETGNQNPECCEQTGNLLSGNVNQMMFSE